MYTTMRLTSWKSTSALPRWKLCCVIMHPTTIICHALIIARLDLLAHAANAALLVFGITVFGVGSWQQTASWKQAEPGTWCAILHWLDRCSCWRQCLCIKACARQGNNRWHSLWPRRLRHCDHLVPASPIGVAAMQLSILVADCRCW